MAVNKKIADLTFRCLDDDNLRPFCTNEDLHVKNTPHYRFAMGLVNHLEFDVGSDDGIPYVEWHKSRGRSQDNVDQKVIKTLNLFDSISKNGLKKPIIIKKGTNEIHDGHHRAAICAALGYREIPCKEV